MGKMVEYLTLIAPGRPCGSQETSRPTLAALCLYETVFKDPDAPPRGPGHRAERVRAEHGAEPYGGRATKT